MLVCVCWSASAAVSQPLPAADFISFINERFSSLDAKSPKRSGPFRCSFDSDPLAARVLAEYGAMFAASDAVTIPDTCIFLNSEAVAAFQTNLKSSGTELAGTRIELQTPAATALASALEEASESYVRISPFDPPVAARRDYNESVRIWNKRLLPALEYWRRSGIITEEESFAIRNMPFADQARRVLEWESRGYKFGTGRVKSIFASCSPPGASQHLALLAFDILQYSDRRVRRILNSHGWFQTVVDDPGHFTYLGVTETELPARGLKLVPAGGYLYWVPDIRRPALPPPVTAVTLTSD